MNYECLNPQGSAAVELQVLVDYQITDQKKTDWISKITIITSALDVMCGVILSVNSSKIFQWINQTLYSNFVVV